VQVYRTRSRSHLPNQAPTLVERRGRRLLAGYACRVPSPQPVAASIAIRLATTADAASIAEIYNHEVSNTTATLDIVPRTLGEQQDWLTARSGAFAAIVAVDTESRRVLGFASLSPYKERAGYRTTVEDSIYVHRQHTGSGIGKGLLMRLIEVARESGFHSMIARIEAGGEASRALHARCGFELVGVEHEVGRKFNRWLSVAVMQLML
jgi:L-amino acid N-acyltransferase